MNNKARWIPLLLPLFVTACSCAGDRDERLREAAPVPTTLEVDASDLFFDALGEERQLSATVRDQKNQVMEGQAVAWSSRDPDVADVGGTGRVVAKGNGVTSLVATVGGLHVMVTVTVEQRPISVEIDPPQLSLDHIGAQQGLHASALDRNGHPVAGARFSWRSADPSVAGVDAEGRVTAEGYGDTEVRASLLGEELSASADVLVRPIPTELRVQLFTGDFVAGVPGEVRVSLLDAGGQRVMGGSFDVQLELGRNPGGATLRGELIAEASGGLAIFSHVTLDKVGEGYTFLASIVEGAWGESDAFDVRPGAPAGIVFAEPPRDGIAGVALAPVAVAVVDAFGNFAPTGSHEIEVKLETGEGALEGNTRASSNEGSATFAHLVVTLAAEEHHLIAKSASLGAEARSTPFRVAPAAPDALVWLAQPRDVVSEETLPPVEVAVVDRFGNRAKSYAAAVELSLDDEREARLEGSAKVEAISGLARFDELSVARAGRYRLVASSSSLAPQPSESFEVKAGPAAALRFSRWPSRGNKGEALPSSEVEIVDAAGNLTDESQEVSVSLLGGPGSLSGTLSVAAEDGVATFADLRIDEAGEGYRLLASAEELEAAESPPFDVGSCSGDLSECEDGCVDPSQDPMNCGGCGIACRDDQICAGACVCPEGESECDGRCVDFGTDPENCGACGAPACGPEEACRAGSCVPSCPEGQDFCDGACVDVEENPDHCGGCNNTCGAGLCFAGGCVPDFEWAVWPVPAEEPADTDYQVDAGAGTVLDLVTRLMWQLEVPAQKYDWEGAKDYCAGLQLGGHDDWRLPTRIELISITQMTTDGNSRKHRDPAINRNVFPDTPPENTWSASVYVDQADTAWYVDFFDGKARGGTVDVEMRVRCVRLGPGYPDLAALGPHYTTGTSGGMDYVRDNWTGLSWQNSNFKPGSIDGLLRAQVICTNLTVDGDFGTLPYRKQLETLVDVRVATPALSPPFRGATVETWTRTLGEIWINPHYPSFGPPYFYDNWYIDFRWGGTAITSGDSSLGVRCMKRERP